MQSVKGILTWTVLPFIMSQALRTDYEQRAMEVAAGGNRVPIFQKKFGVSCRRVKGCKERGEIVGQPQTCLCRVQ